jgi:flavodoxin
MPGYFARHFFIHKEGIMGRTLSKIILVLLAGLLIFSPLNAAQKKGVKKMKTLIVYYSYTGNTELIAKTMATELKADLLKIEDAQTPSKFKAYIKGAFAARKGEPWPIKTVNVLLKDYDRVFIGGPIWWGRVAPSLNGYVEQADLKDRSVIVFVTMGGSEPAEAIKALSASIEAKGAKVVSSFSVKTGGAKKEDLVSKAKEAAKQYQ